MRFRESLLLSEEEDSRIPAGERIQKGQHLRIEGPSSSDDGDAPAAANAGFEPTRLALVSTIQFVAALSRLKDDLTSEYFDPRHPSGPIGLLENGESKAESAVVGTDSSARGFWTGKYDAVIPQSKPLSPGEILGCTAPYLNNVDALL